MQKKILSVLVVAALVLSGFVIVAAQSNVQAASSDDLLPFTGGTNAAIASDEIGSGDGSAYSADSVAASATIQKTYLALNTARGYLEPTVFNYRGENDYCEVWTADDMLFPADDPLFRNNDMSRLTITDDMVTMIMEQFASIYAIEAQYFGEPNNKVGSDTISLSGYTFDGFPTEDGQKTMIMIFNIRDNSYYDPNTYTTYTVGFFSSGVDDLYNRNIIHLDSWRWADRTGEQPVESGHYSYLYEATTAHEYQHLLHHDMDPEESTWLNEGCSMYAEMLCGYGVPYDYLNQFMLYPDNSLTVWGDQGDNLIIGDYGAAAMFLIYLNDKYGGSSTISALAHSKLHDMESVTYTLRKVGYRTTFDDVFKNFRLANVLRSTVLSSKYGYTSLDYDSLSSPYGYEYSVTWGMVERSEVAYVTGYGIDAYGTDYFLIYGDSWTNLKKSQYKFVFDGQDTVQTGWQIVNVDGTDYMWSGMGDMKDFWLMSDAISLAAGDHVFSLDTILNIEDNWDFGFVQYSTDGVNWISMSNDYTTDEYETDVAEIAANLPGLTGYSDGMISMEFGLTLDAASSVQFRLRYMTDEATNGAYEAGLEERVGWLANNFAVDGSAISMPNSNSVAQDIDYLVTIYGDAVGTRTLVKIADLKLDDKTSVGSMPMSIFTGYTYLLVVISPTDGPCTYEFGVVHK